MGCNARQDAELYFWMRAFCPWLKDLVGCEYDSDFCPNSLSDMFVTHFVAVTHFCLWEWHHHQLKLQTRLARDVRTEVLLIF